MKKPELKDFDYDGADMADWYKGYSEALENYTEHIESTNQQLIDALGEANRLSSAVIRGRIGHIGDHGVYASQIDMNFADKLHHQIKAALSNAGEES